MKRFLLMAGLVLLATACVKNIKTEVASLEEDVPLEEQGIYTLSMMISVEYPVSGVNASALQHMRSAITERCFGEEYDSLSGSLPELCAAYKEDSYALYHAACEETLAEAPLDAEPLCNWSREILGNFGPRWKDWVVYQASFYEFSGGAHGMFYSMPMVLDASTGMPVPYTTFTGSRSTDEICALLDKYKFAAVEDVLNESGIEDADVFYVDRIDPSEYFTVGPEGLSFVYQPYDIAPYVFGIITITIPWNELK